MVNKEDSDKVKSILSFLIIIFGESSGESLRHIFSFSPDYLLEKWYLYLTEPIRHKVGMHRLLVDSLYDDYCKYWGLENG